MHFADEAVHIGPSPAGKSYLNIDAVIAAARQIRRRRDPSGLWLSCPRIADFAEAVAAAGLVFVGPDRRDDPDDGRQGRGARGGGQAPACRRCRAATARRRSRSRRAPRRGEDRLSGDDQGGGRRRRPRHPRRRTTRRSFEQQFRTRASRGQGRLRRWRRSIWNASSQRARHVEVQVLGDGEHAIHCFERECSLQRRRQKVWEEAPSPASTTTRARRSARRPCGLPSASATAGAGTLEYLYDEDSRRVLLHRDEHAHPGRASGHRDDHRHRPRARDDPHRRRRAAATASRPTSQMRGACHRGAASTPRIRTRTSCPSPGTSARCSAAGRAGRALRHHALSGYAVPPFYDSLLGKLIVHADETREQALARLRARARRARRSRASSRRRARCTSGSSDETTCGRHGSTPIFWSAGWQPSRRRLIGGRGLATRSRDSA